MTLVEESTADEARECQITQTAAVRPKHEATEKGSDIPGKVLKGRQECLQERLNIKLYSENRLLKYCQDTNIDTITFIQMKER